MFKHVLNSYLRLSTLVDGSILLESFSFRWIVRHIRPMLGQFCSEVIVCFKSVCPVYLGLSFLRSDFWDGVI